MKTTTWNACITGLATLALGVAASWGGTNGYVQVWGSSEYGLQSVPAAVLSNATTVAAGWYHCLALVNGRVYAWGDNEKGQTNVPVNAASEVTAIAAGAMSSAAIRNGQIILWGTSTTETDQVAFNDGPDSQYAYTAVALGANHGLALCRDDGHVEGWGNESGDKVRGPMRDWGTGIKAIAAGNEFSVGLNQDGKVLVAGHPNNALNESLRVDDIPENAQSGVDAIAAGPYHVMALKKGEVMVWGAWFDDSPSAGGATPKGSWGNVTNVPDSAKSGVVAIAAGNNVCAAIKTNGVVVIWGNKQGSGSVHTIPSCASRDVKEIALGLRHAMARTSYLSPAFTTESLPDGYLESPYEGGVSALGDPAPSFHLEEANIRPLPAGLQLNSDGSITGTPEKTGTNWFRVTVSNSYGTVTSNFAIAVHPRKARVPTWKTTSLPQAVIGTWYEAWLQATENPTFTYDQMLQPLPPWATLSPSGLISGWPTNEPGSVSPTFVATNEAGFATRVLELATVNPTAVPAIAGEGPLPDGVSESVYGATNTLHLPGGGVAFGYQLDITGASSVNRVEGRLPAGLQLHGTNGFYWIGGTPTVTGDDTTFVLEAENPAGKSRGTWSISVKGKPEWVTPVGALKDGAKGVRYEDTLEAKWATGYRLTSGSLPAGLSLGQEAGADWTLAKISGTPEAVTDGDMAFEVLASNEYGETDARRFTIRVTDKVMPELKLTGIAVQGGTAVLTWINERGEDTTAWVGGTDDLKAGWATNGTPASLGWVKTNSPARLDGQTSPRYYMLWAPD